MSIKSRCVTGWPQSLGFFEAIFEAILEVNLKSITTQITWLCSGLDKSAASAGTGWQGAEISDLWVRFDDLTWDGFSAGRSLDDLMWDGFSAERSLVWATAAFLTEPNRDEPRRTERRSSSS
ncbi:hypothetical protein BTUL_0242g00160 [Botrytis tulipae]|uniref:Uncharacterized protein n=1 Tax=Botrytis tulipae TaxID=87230 RepID=A0A4Z1EEM3_9HELO|nr:hypothetical protein BTUL_0242g00160 [Botrytis tulipae]